MSKIKFSLLTGDLGDAEAGKEPRLVSKLPPSIIYYCKDCGNTWAKIDTGNYWIAMQRKCPEHGPGFLAVYKDKRYALSEEALSREIDLMLSYSGDYEVHLLTGGV